MKNVRALATGSLIVTALLPSTAFAVGTGGIPASLPSTELAEGTMVEVPVVTELSHPVSLEDALSWSQSARTAAPVEGVRFESESVVGEYWMTADRSPEAFLEAFEADTGTVPEVVALLSTESIPIEDALAGDVREESVTISAPEFSAPPAVVTDENSARFAEEHPETPSSERLAPGDRWTPRTVTSWITRSAAFTNSIEIKQNYEWHGLDPFNSPGLMPNHWGAEFGVDFYTDLPQYQVGMRPSCWAGFEESTAATNDAYTWWVMVTTGTEYVMDPGPIGFYGDYFDSLDACNRASIAVGAANPQAIPSDIWGTGTNYISVTILATKGNATASRIGGNVQAVERYSCEAAPSTPLTVCMGLDTSLGFPGPGPQAQLTKNTSPAWYAPDLCWYTPDHGAAAYDMGCQMPPS